MIRMTIKDALRNEKHVENIKFEKVLRPNK